MRASLVRQVACVVIAAAATAAQVATALAIIPEPGTAGMMTIAGFALIRRRK